MLRDLLQLVLCLVIGLCRNLELGINNDVALVITPVLSPVFVLLPRQRRLLLPYHLCQVSLLHGAAEHLFIDEEFQRNMATQA